MDGGAVDIFLGNLGSSLCIIQPGISHDVLWGFPGGSEVKASVCNAGHPGSIPGYGRSPGEGNGNPLQYSCLENPMDGEAWWAAIYGAKNVLVLPTKTFFFLKRAFWVNADHEHTAV